MTTWKDSIQIEAPIEVVWNIFSEDNFKRVMPKVTSHELISFDKTTNTSIYKETYREGKREETYELTETIILDSANEKESIFHFTIAKMIHSNGKFHLKQLDEQTTIFTYSGETKGVSFLGKTMMKLASKKKDEQIVTEFLQLVKQEAESDYKIS